MARPKSTGAEYFAHLKEDRNERTLKALMNIHGLTAYSVYFITLEILCGAEGNRIDYSPKETFLVAGDIGFGLSKEELSEIWRSAIDLDLLQLEEKSEEDGSGQFWLYSPELNKRLEPLKAKREKDRLRREAAKKSYRGDNQGKRGDNQPKPEVPAAKKPQSKGKDSKGKDSKGKDSKSAEEEVDFLGEKQKELISKLCEFNTIRVGQWKVRAKEAGVDLETLQKQFCNRIIQDSGSEDKKSLIAGFDKYLLVTESNRNEQTTTKKGKGGQKLGIFPSKVHGGRGGFVDTSKQKDDAAFAD